MQEEEHLSKNERIVSQPLHQFNVSTDSASLPPTSVNIPSEHWTPQRQELADWFQQKAPHLEALYKAALMLLNNPIFPARERLIAHAVREIGNRLPDVVGTKIAKNEKVDTTNRLDKIVCIWRKDGLPVDFSTPMAIESAASDGDVGILIPSSTAKAMMELIRDHANSRETRKDAAIRLLREIAPDSGVSLDQLRPIALRWLTVLKWFQENVHVGDSDRAISEEEFQRYFELFEQYLGSMLRPFFSTFKELNDFLDQANR
jgi:hypothetical protein